MCHLVQYKRKEISQMTTKKMDILKPEKEENGDMASQLRKTNEC
jgi:hypothetical protein